MRLAVAKMAQLAAEFGVDAVAAATAFANAAGQSTDFLKKGVDGFAKLADFKAIPQEAMNLFAQGVVHWSIRLSTYRACSRMRR